MNFLSHYYIDNIDEQVVHNFGLMFPDFMGMCNRGLHVNKIINQVDNVELMGGIQKHFSLDNLWHHHQVFDALRFKLKQILRQYGFSASPYRPFFITHIIAEIGIDRIIALNEPNKIDQLYKDVAVFEAQHMQVVHFLPTKNKLRMETFLETFIDAKYVYKYADNESFIYTLNRMFERVNNPILKFEKPAQLHNFVKQIDECIQNDFDAIFKSMSKDRI